METLATLTRNYLALPMERHVFAWQGGEPTLMGTAFFERAFQMQKEFSAGVPVENALQTNGTLLDDRWGALLCENRVLTGISVDGPGPLHDRYRTGCDGRGSFRAVRRGVEVLKRHGVEFNVLALVTAANQDRPEEVYRSLRDMGALHQQYIECVEFDASGARRPFSLAQGRWGEFLCRLFDAWYPNDVGTVSIRLFDAILSRLTGGAPALCTLSPRCDGYLVIEADGDVYPCDFYVRDAFRLGNVRTDSFETLRRRQFDSGFPARKPPAGSACTQCRFLPLCMGDCPRLRQAERSVLCSDWRLFYEHTIERFEALASRMEAGAR